MTSINWQHVVKHAAAPVVVGLFGILSLWMTGSYAGVVVVLVIILCWVGVIAHLAVNRQLLVRQNRTLGRLETLTQSVAEHPSVEPQDDALVRALERRQRRMEKTLNDVAGTVGRSAPRIRAVETMVSRPVSLASTAPTGSSPVPARASLKPLSELPPPCQWTCRSPSL